MRGGGQGDTGLTHHRRVQRAHQPAEMLFYISCTQLSVAGAEVCCLFSSQCQATNLGTEH